jgi:uncharacterized membrane protein
MAKAKDVDVQKIGEWAFILGVLLAILVGLVPTAFSEVQTYVTIVLVILGILVGLINITTKQAQEFLIASIALLVAGAAGLQVLPYVGPYVAQIISNIIAFVAPAAVIVALKAVYELGR